MKYKLNILDLALSYLVLILMYQIVLMKGGIHRVVRSGLNLDQASEETKKIKQKYEDDFLVELMRLTSHMKTCDDPTHIREISDIIDTKNFEFYYRKEGDPIFVLIIKYLNPEYHNKFIKENKGKIKVTRDEYIEQERFYNFEDMDRICALYEPFVNKGIFLMKILPSHEIKLNHEMF